MNNVYRLKMPTTMTKEETLELFLEYKTGNTEARDKIIAGNLKLVKHIAKKYHSESADAEDLFNIGVIGLIKAVDTFDIGAKSTFSNYAYICILNEIKMFFRKGKVSFGKYKELKNKIDNYINDVYVKTGIEPSIEEISKELGISIDAITRSLKIERVISFEEYIVENDALTIENILVSDDNIEDRVIKESEKENLKNIISLLPVKERIATELFYIEMLRVKDLIKLMGLSRTYVTLLIRNGMLKMKEIASKGFRDEEFSNIRIKKNEEKFGVTINVIKDILMNTDEIHRTIFMDLNPFDGSMPKTFREIKALLELSYGEIYKYYNETIDMIKKEIKQQKLKSKGNSRKPVNNKGIIADANNDIENESKTICIAFPDATEDQIREALTKLNSKYKEVFLTTFPIGQKKRKMKDISKILNIPIGSLTYIINKSVELLSRELKMEPNNEIFRKNSRKKDDILNTTESSLPLNDIPTTSSKDIKSTDITSSILTDEQKNYLKHLIKMLDDEFQATILLLKFGLIRDKQFSNREIAEFFNIEESDLITMSNMALTKLKNITTSITDSASILSPLIESKHK